MSVKNNVSVRELLYKDLRFTLLLLPLIHYSLRFYPYFLLISNPFCLRKPVSSVKTVKQMDIFHQGQVYNSFCVPIIVSTIFMVSNQLRTNTKGGVESKTLTVYIYVSTSVCIKNIYMCTHRHTHIYAYICIYYIYM